MTRYYLNESEIDRIQVAPSFAVGNPRDYFDSIVATVAKAGSDKGYRTACQDVFDFHKDYFANPEVMTAIQFQKKWGVWDDNFYACLRLWLKQKGAL